MAVARNSVVLIQYKLTNDSGEVLDQSEAGSPLAYIHGRGNIIPGLERELEGKSAGDKLQVTVKPAEAYGEYDQQLIQSVPRKAIQGVDDIQEGMQLHARSNEGVRVLTVKKVENDTVTLDANHPLAGKTLHFDVEIEDVRQATQEELTHGHVHGQGGHQH